MKLKKTIAVVLGIVALFASSSINAQFSAGLELGLPTGNFSEMASPAFGGSIRYDATISDKISWTASLGYLSFAGKNYTFPGTNVTIPFGTTSNTPLAAGVKYYFQESNNGFYGAADISFNFLSTWKYTYNSGNGGGYNLAAESSTVIGVNPGLGYRLSNWDFAVRYNLLGDYSYLGLRAAYVFGGD